MKYLQNNYIRNIKTCYMIEENNKEEKYLEALKATQKLIIRDFTSLKIWKSQAINIIVRIYGKNSRQELQLDNIKYNSYSIGTHRGGNNIEECKRLAEGYINSYIYDIEMFGLPNLTEENNNGINIELNQNQNQTVNIDVFWGVVKDELTGKQLKEVEDILKDPKEKPEAKKSKILDKIKSFGGNVASNIVAGLITNPSLYF